MKRLAAWCFLIFYLAGTYGCSRISTLYVFNGSPSGVEFIAIQNGRRDSYIVPPGEWIKTAREYKPEHWQFEFKSSGAETTAGVLDHNYSSADEFIEIDERGWRERGTPAWYFLRTRLGPIVASLIAAGLAALAVIVSRREKARRATSKPPER